MAAGEESLTGIAARPSADMPVARIIMEDPWTWLSKGTSDMRAVPGISLTYGAVFAAVSAALTAGLYALDWEYLLLPMVAGFMLLGPMLAVGLYETSRRLEKGERPWLGQVLVVHTRSPVQLAFIGALLAIALLFWIRIATLLYALFMSDSQSPALGEVAGHLLGDPAGLTMLIIGTLVGGLIAFAVFAVSVVSIPMLMVRDTDAVTAVIVSLRAVAANWKPMLLWAWLITIITAAGLVTFYIGLIFTFPLIGHASWHAYRSLIEGE